MSASQILLAGHGQEDQWLSDNPNMTYFEAKYQPRVNRSRETYEIPFDNQDATFGSTGRCTIPVKGDYLTRLTLRAVFPPIYPTVPGQYVFPTPSSDVGGNVYVNMGLTLVVADGVTLTANTAGSHYFSIGAGVTLTGTGTLDGTFTIASIPTANSFTCSATLTGTSTTGTVSSLGIVCGDIISYFSTANSNLWVNNVTNKTWQIASASVVGNQLTFTTSEPSNFPVGSLISLNLPGSGRINLTSNIVSVNTCILSNSFVTTGLFGTQAFSSDGGKSWSYADNQFSGAWWGTAYGNGTFVMVSTGAQAYSVDNGFTWKYVPSSLTGGWSTVTYANGRFVMAGGASQAYSLDGITWTPASTTVSSLWYGSSYGTGTFVITGSASQAYSTNNGQNWTSVASPLSGNWFGIAYGNSKFAMVGIGGQAYSTTGQSWTPVSSPISGAWYGVTFGAGKFVMVGSGNQAYSTDAQTWTPVTSPLPGNWNDVTYGDGVFVMVGDYNQAYSVDGQTWISVNVPLSSASFYSITFGQFSYTNSISDSVSLLTPALQLTNRNFSSNVYPSISFANAADAAFWGFDARNGLTYSLPATPPWTLTQSGWISGFLPPSSSTYDDSVAHKLCKDVRILVGKQTIKEYSGEYIELQNDLIVPYENKAILKLMNGTLDQTQAVSEREYYVNLPLGTKEIPLCALTHQNMSVEVDFESFTNLSQNLNAGTGDFLDAKSYTTYDASTGILGGQPVNIRTTFSYQQYIFAVTYGGQFIIFDTTTDVSDPASYIVISGSSNFRQFCVFSGNLYIGQTDGQLARVTLSELVQGNTTSLTLNNYVPTIGTLTGTLVADFRYVYYTVNNTATSNVFLSRYDTTGGFTSTSSYTTVDFTKTFNSSVNGVYQTLFTGTELVLMPQGVPGKLYTYQLNSNVQSQWYVLNYSSYGYQITEGVLIGSTLYFVSDFNIISLNSGVLSVSTLDFGLFSMGGTSFAYSLNNGKTWANITGSPGSYDILYTNQLFVAVGDGQYYSVDGKTWSNATTPLTGYQVSWSGVTYGNGKYVIVGQDFFNVGLNTGYSYDGKTWYAGNTLSGECFSRVAFGEKRFVAVGLYGVLSTNPAQAYSDDGVSWSYTTTPFNYRYNSVAFGNGRFVAVGGTSISDAPQIYSNDGKTWQAVVSSLTGRWIGVTFGAGKFVMVGEDVQAYSSDGLSWTPVTSPLGGTWYDVTYENGVFVMVGINVQAYSIDGQSWNTSIPLSGIWRGVAGKPGQYSFSGTGFKNLLAMGNYIYCSSETTAFRIDTTKDLSTITAYEYPAPLEVGQYIFANGPRYVYMFAQGDNSAKNIVEFDPYGPDTTFKTSILVDYESLPPEVPKPDKALLGLIQTQKVTDMTQMNIKGPVKELWVTGPSATTNVFQYSNLAPRSSLALTGEKIVTEDDGTHTFLNIIEPFETHTAMPLRNVSVVAFELDPESEIPNGTINFSRIRDQVFEGGAQTVWARNYNLLAIQGGIGGLIFNS